MKKENNSKQVRKESPDKEIKLTKKAEKPGGVSQSSWLDPYQKALNKCTHKIFIEMKRKALKNSGVKTELMFDPIENFKYFNMWLPVYIQKTEVDLHYDRNLSDQSKKLILMKEQEEDKSDENTANYSEEFQEILKSFEFFQKKWPIRISSIHS